MAYTPRLAHGALAASAAAALAGSLLLTASPAGAAPATTTTFSAVASWAPASGSSGANVSLQVNEESGPTGSFLFFVVNESSCTSGGFRGLGYFFGGPAPEAFTVSRNLAAAVLVSPAIQGTLTTTTSPVCDGTDLTSVSTSAQVSAFGKWSATGPAQTTFPGNVVRPANADVQLTGPSVLGFAGLGAPDFAQISSFTAQ